MSQFAAQARCYCSLVEDAGPCDPQFFAQEALEQILRLYLLALRIPHVTPEGERLPSIENGEWNAMLAKISRKIPADFYWEMSDPLPLNRDDLSPGVGSLADDLADIWRDLKPGLDAMSNTGGPISESMIAWYWRWSFEHHWGRHAAGAISVLHAVCFEISP